MRDLEIIITSDGSHTLRNKSLNETYHSIHGAVRESTHVFIRHGLQHFCEQHHPKEVAILEVGFGTGLNALLALQYATGNNISIRYTTLEPFPLTEQVWSNLNYAADEKAQEHFKALHEAGWNREVSVAAGFAILKMQATLQEAVLSNLYDVIYFDAFAPSIQPELWDYPALEKVVRVLKKGGVFVTYSAKGQLKRDLRSMGLVVETLKGPPGKNEMVGGRREA
jgi:tRNA U34 5-methylaminomethyl-2-thiouridine-forming methyltransferase MnmC